MQNFKKMVITAALATTTAISGCVSTTTAGTISPERKQLLIVSSGEILRLSSEYYRETLAEARTKGTLDNNPAQVARLRKIADRLIPQAALLRPDAANWQWKVHTITDNTINAYVMPGGKIVFYTGIIEKLNLTDDEIAAIMGHEMAHAIREHSREKMSRKMATNGTLGIAGAALGLGGWQAQVVGLAGEIGLNLPHSRTQEAEADKIGLELMARAGYNPGAAATLWQKMDASKETKMPQFLSTHPSSANRIKELQALAPQVQHLYQQAK